MHPINSAETAVCIDAIHQNLQPNEYIKHDDSPECFVSKRIGGRHIEIIFHFYMDGRPITTLYYSKVGGCADSLLKMAHGIEQWRELNHDKTRRKAQ